jgi:hypothetical protein
MSTMTVDEAIEVIRQTIKWSSNPAPYTALDVIKEALAHRALTQPDIGQVLDEALLPYQILSNETTTIPVCEIKQHLKTIRAKYCTPEPNEKPTLKGIVEAWLESEKDYAFYAKAKEKAQRLLDQLKELP